MMRKDAAIAIVHGDPFDKAALPTAKIDNIPSLGQVVLAPEEREELERRARSRSLAAELVKKSEGYSDVGRRSLL